jgi:hypothetical protein
MPAGLLPFEGVAEVSPLAHASWVRAGWRCRTSRAAGHQVCGARIREACRDVRICAMLPGRRMWQS